LVHTKYALVHIMYKATQFHLSHSLRFATYAKRRNAASPACLGRSKRACHAREEALQT
jgi:hypothetical protein